MPTQDDLETGRPGLSTMAFIDPQNDAGRRHVEIPASQPRPLPRELRPLTAQIPGAGRTRDLDAWVSETHTTALLVLDGPLGQGSVVHEWYAAGVDAESLLLGASMTKSVLAHLVGNAIASGAMQLEDAVTQHVPELAGSGYAGCTVEHVLTMTSGTDWVEDHRDPNGPATRLISCFAGDGGSSRDLLGQVAAMDPPGTRWEYSTADSQVLDWVRERATGTHLRRGADRAVASPGLRPRRCRGSRRRGRAPGRRGTGRLCRGLAAARGGPAHRHGVRRTRARS